MKNRITKSERLQLLGLLTLARKHQRTSDLAHDEIHSILDEPDNYSLMSDAIFEKEDQDIDKLLEKMDIKVEG